MAQSGWRLPDDLLRRVRIRAAETGEKQNAFVERALESALAGDVPRTRVENLRETERGEIVAADPSRPVSFRSPKSVPGVKTAREIASERQAALNKAKKS